MSDPNTKTKPTVYFTKILGIQEYADDAYGFLIDGVKGHPMLGDSEQCGTVRTSSVAHVTYCPNGDIAAFETRNTIYIRKERA